MRPPPFCGPLCGPKESLVWVVLSAWRSPAREARQNDTERPAASAARAWCVTNPFAGGTYDTRAADFATFFSTGTHGRRVRGAVGRRRPGGPRSDAAGVQRGSAVPA